MRQTGERALGRAGERCTNMRQHAGDASLLDKLVKTTHCGLADTLAFWPKGGMTPLGRVAPGMRRVKAKHADRLSRCSARITEVKHSGSG